MFIKGGLPEWRRLTPGPPFPGSAGFYGKLPARGDFVRGGLPRDFTLDWDRWWQAVLSGSRDLLGDGWAEVWLQAPIWCFALPPGLCGNSAVLGLWLPSVDRAGRYFPLTLAAAAPDGRAALMASGGAFLRLAELAGLAALEQDLTPEALAERVLAASAAPAEAVDPVAPFDGVLGHHALWWTRGNALVAAQACSTAALPGVAAFTAMIAGPAGEAV